MFIIKVPSPLYSMNNILYVHIILIKDSFEKVIITESFFGCPFFPQQIQDF